MMNRTVAPPFQKLDAIDLLQVKQHQLTNHVPVFQIQTGKNPVVRIEFFFNAGTLAEQKSATSFFTAKTLLEGTQKRNAAEISEYIERFGAFLEVGQGLDQFYITLYVLQKYLPKILPIINDLLTEAIFPNTELTLNKQIALQNLEINLQKNAYIASQKFREMLFGEQHPYGKALHAETIHAITQEDLQEFYKQRIKHKSFEIFVASSSEGQELEHLEHFFGKMPLQKVSKPHRIKTQFEPTNSKIIVPKDGSVQSSIRIGKKLFNKTHPDFQKLKILNTILGGYFGSRLMKNIREEKGLTYGIYSQLASLQYDGYWVIGADVNKENTQLTIDEIFVEMRKLIEQPVQEEELERVKNYIMGAFASSINTPFDLIDKFKGVHFYNLNYDYYDQYFALIQNIQADTLQVMAQEYLQPESFMTIVVGGE